MNFQEMLLEMLLEGKLEDTLDRHHTIPDDVKQDYLSQIPAKNAQHLDWVLSQHTKGNIKPEHDINGILSNFNKVRDKLSKKQIHQYSSMDELHAAITPHQDNIKKSDNEKSKDGTETLYSSPTMTIKQHHNYESCISAANLPASNKSKKDKAEWCVSVGDGGGARHYSSYTDNGFHPVYTIEHHHSNGTSSKHMLVYDHNKTQGRQELRNEFDNRPGFNDYSSTRSDLLDHYGTEHPELLKTPIAKLFSEEGREEYNKESKPAHKKLLAALGNIPRSGMTDDKYMEYFKEGQKKQQGGIHNALAKSELSPTQLTHLIEHGNQGCKHILANREDLSDTHIKKLANTSNTLVHEKLLDKLILPDDAFNIIINKAHPSIINRLINHANFYLDSAHKLLDKKMNNVDLSQMVYDYHEYLSPKHISSIIDKGDANTSITLLNNHYDKLTHEHIQSLMNKGNDDINNALQINKDIDKNINNIIDNGSHDDHNVLINENHHKLTANHISKLIGRGIPKTSSMILNNLPKKLKSHHITDLINKGNISMGDGLILTKFKHNLSPENISALIDKGDGDTIHRLTVEIPHKLEPQHINALIANGNHDDHIKSAYDKLSTESKKIVDAHKPKVIPLTIRQNFDNKYKLSFRQQFDKKYKLKECHNVNSDFERLLKESLITR